MDPRKAMVRDAYDAIAETWGRERDTMDDPREHAWVERFRSSLTGTRVLDLGCGGGAILTRLVARGLRVTGVDFSRAQLDRARVACPSAALVQSDMAEVEFADASFDGVIVYDSLWHLPREEHGAVLGRIRRWAVDGAPLLFSVGALDPNDPGDVDTQLCGAPIFYAAWPRETTFDLLRAAGFDLVAFDDTPGRALLVLARAV
jgi:cyclopropane fatty-acyl-phospholipid synthase-like methyltransferase